MLKHLAGSFLFFYSPTYRDRCFSAFSYSSSPSIFFSVGLQFYSLSLSLFLSFFYPWWMPLLTSAIVWLLYMDVKGMDGMDGTKVYESNNALEPSLCIYRTVCVCVSVCSNSTHLITFVLRWAQILRACGCHCILPVLLCSRCNIAQSQMWLITRSISNLLQYL